MNLIYWILILIAIGFILAVSTLVVVEVIISELIKYGVAA